MTDLIKLSNILNISEVKTLDLSGTTDFSGLEAFTSLQSLSFNKSCLRYVPSELSALKYLKILSAAKNNLQEIPQLPKKLEQLDISSNSFTSLNLFNLPVLIELNISNNRIHSVDGLSHLFSLKYLYCSKNLISSLQPLSRSHILELDASDNQIANIESLTGLLNSIQVLAIKNNPCTRLCNFSGSLHMFVLHPSQIYRKNPLNIEKSRLLKDFVPTKSLTLNKNLLLGKALKELEEVKQKNQKLEKKVKSIETRIESGDTVADSLRETQSMSYEDWLSSLFRYNILKILHAKRVRQLGNYEEIYPIKQSRKKPYKPYK